MRSFAPIAIVGSLLLAAGLGAQSLTENAAAIAGATIGTAAGKPLGTALGNIFGKLDKDTDKAANAKTAKTPKTAKTEKTEKTDKKVEPAASGATKETASTPSFSAHPANPGPQGDVSVPASGGGRSREVYRTETAPSAFAPSATTFAAAAPVEPSMRQLSAADVANLRVGSSGQEMQSALGVPESRVIIPGDDGRLVESCQYWSHGQRIGTVHLVNGQVVSVASDSTN